MEIPQDLWNEIFLYLPLPDLLPIGFTSSEWCHFVLEIFPDLKQYRKTGLVSLDKHLYPCNTMELVLWWSTFHKPCFAEFRRIYRLNDFQLLEMNSLIFNTRGLIESLAREGHLESIRWMDQTFANGGIPADRWSSAAGGAAAEGRIEVLEYMLNRPHGKRTVKESLKKAAANGQIQVIEWAFQHKLNRDFAGVMHAAVYGGQLELLKWLQARGHKVNRAMRKRPELIYVPRGVDDESAIQVMEGLVELGAKHTRFSLAQMIRQGFKKSIIHLLRAGLPWTKDDSLKCLIYQGPSFYQWARETLDVAPIDRSTPRAMVEVEAKGRVDSILYLYNEVGFVPNPDFLFTKNGNPKKDAVEILRNEGYPVDESDHVERNLKARGRGSELRHVLGHVGGERYFHYYRSNVEDNILQAREARRKKQKIEHDGGSP
ncbi:hypothetical protein PROFUN_01079 [Planoprotostelium fungivorum]|uniref:F-box domain-containing protein n=1 Tax=Planoprotostelium fungivorum TaxID=1890364 RepID=A0A2P6NCB9_9EUKA|nr:hypothetical protein PROFUN_01079 [Planoprotostelium fungivorum]